MFALTSPQPPIPSRGRCSNTSSFRLVYSATCKQPQHLPLMKIVHLKDGGSVQHEIAVDRSWIRFVSNGLLQICTGSNNNWTPVNQFERCISKRLTQDLHKELLIGFGPHKLRFHKRSLLQCLVDAISGANLKRQFLKLKSVRFKNV